MKQQKINKKKKKKSSNQKVKNPNLVNDYLGDREFEEYLNKIDLALTVWEIKSLVLGVVIGLEMIPPSIVLADLLLLEGDEEFEFENEADYEGFILRFYSLWNHLVDFSIQSKPYESIALAKDLAGEDYMFALEIKAFEVNNFVSSLFETGSVDISKSYEKYHEAVSSFISLTEELDELLIDFKVGDHIQEKKVIELYKKSDEVFRNEFLVIASTLQSLREKEILQ